jgi:hypothetical protein
MKGKYNGKILWICPDDGLYNVVAKSQANSHTSVPKSVEIVYHCAQEENKMEIGDYLYWVSQE